ncbi:MAG TPA: phosphohistidine phosphatase SixA [Anaerolineales bacterium]|nr:phosphohistidine phosphatase SixA [Anaerolineales bacterium]HLO32630.1 phosphohistidine phosphatase SixA [Anaerolineales bacterium]
MLKIAAIEVGSNAMRMVIGEVAEGTSNYESDSERPLTDKGRKKMRQIARGPRHLGVEFDLILSSPYVRARETAQILADVLKVKKKFAFSEILTPMADPQLLIPEINEKYSMDSIALVGHEPHLSGFIGLLTTEDTMLSVTLKKGGVCYLSADDLHHGDHRATLEWLLTPGILMEIGDK